MRKVCRGGGPDTDVDFRQEEFDSSSNQICWPGDALAVAVARA